MVVIQPRSASLASFEENEAVNYAHLKMTLCDNAEVRFKQTVEGLPFCLRN